MAKRLIIAEKPDAARTIAGVISKYWKEVFDKKTGYMESSHYIVSWCVGHLVTLAAPEEYDPGLKKWSAEKLPIFPNNWKYSVIPSSSAQFKVLKSLMGRKDVVGLVNAADAGREGELIFRLVYKQAGCKKPVKRLWSSTTAAGDLKQALTHMQPSSDYDSLYYAALCRSQQDWLIGINVTRKYTCEYHRKLTVGRVQTPTLAMVVERDRQIEGFSKAYFYKLCFNDSKGTTFESVRSFDSKEEAEKALASVSQTAPIVSSIKKEEKKISPPMLYSTTALQKDAGVLYGMTPKDTLAVMQSVYDKHLQSYPRTDAIVISSAQADEFKDSLSRIASAYNWQKLENPNVSRLVNNDKIEDHPAVTVTREFSGDKLKNGLSDDEQKILRLTANRMMAAASKDCVYESTRVEAEWGEYVFEAKGIVTLSEGWRQYRKLIASIKADTPLPEYAENERLAVSNFSVSERETKPPSAYTPSTLLDAMEKAGKKDMEKDVERTGIGTSATRAGIIDNLVKVGYLEMHGKNNKLTSTQKGRALIDVMPADLTTVDMTVRWENEMLAIRRTKDAEEARRRTDVLVGETKNFVQNILTSFARSDALSSASAPTAASYGPCPVCGKPVLKARSGKNWYCSGYKDGCSFFIWKEGDKGIYPTLKTSKVSITDSVVKQLLGKGKTSKKKFVSVKTGKPFEASLVLNEYSPRKFGLAFDFPQK